jgi:hypothetical protein
MVSIKPMAAGWQGSERRPRCRLRIVAHDRWALDTRSGKWVRHFYLFSMTRALTGLGVAYRFGSALSATV